jgi:hypothetical protein
MWRFPQPLSKPDETSRIARGERLFRIGALSFAAHFNRTIKFLDQFVHDRISRS